MKDFIYDLITEDEFISRQELRNLTGLSDRLIRNIISDIRKEHCIISLTSEKGYRRAKSTENMTKEEIKVEYDIIKKMIKEDNNRIKNIKKNMRMKIAYLKVLEKETK